MRQAILHEGTVSLCTGGRSWVNFVFLGFWQNWQVYNKWHEVVLKRQTGPFGSTSPSMMGQQLNHLKALWFSHWTCREFTLHCGPRQERSRVRGTKVPGNERSRERMFGGGKVCRVYSFSGTKVPGTNGPRNESFRERTVQERKFHHGNKCSRERIVLRTNVPAFH